MAKKVKNAAKKSKKAAKPRRRVPSVRKGLREEVEKWNEKNGREDIKSVWLKNSKLTYETIFSSPEQLEKEFEAYIQFCKDNPWVRVDYKTTKHGLVKVEIPTAKPITISGFLVFCGVGDKYWGNFIREVAPRDENFGGIIDRIRNLTRTQNIEGATVGTYNANIISRLHGLAENVNTNVNDQRKAAADVFPKKLKNNRSND